MPWFPFIFGTFVMGIALYLDNQDYSSIVWKAPLTGLGFEVVVKLIQELHKTSSYLPT